MKEDYLFYVTLIGLALLVVGWLWMVVVAWRQRAGWGVAVLLFPPAGLLFALGLFAATERIGVTVLRVSLGRMRIDQAFRFFLKWPLALSVLSLAIVAFA